MITQNQLNKINPLKNGLILDDTQIVKEIEHSQEDQDEDYFGDLELEGAYLPPGNERMPTMHSQIIREDKENVIEVRRSKRVIPRPSFFELNENGLTIDNQEDDEFRLIKWRQFTEGDESVQPIEIYVSFQSLLIMHVHAHLFSNEVIGYNAGYMFNHINGKQGIYYHDGYPVVAVENTGEDRTKTVEMDPTSAEENSRLAESRGQTVFGWYHSHPIFDTNPSKTDIDAQESYQKLYSGSDNMPFAGFIVGPYSPSLNSNKVVSEFKCYWVREEDDNKQPYELSVNIVPQKRITTRILQDLMDIYDTSVIAQDRVDLSQRWKGKMKRNEKLKRWIKNLIKQNLEEQETFDVTKIIDSKSDSTHDQIALSILETSQSSSNIHEDGDSVEVNLDEFLSNITENWNIPPKGRKRLSRNQNDLNSRAKSDNIYDKACNKKPSNSSNKIILKIEGEEPVIMDIDK